MSPKIKVSPKNVHLPLSSASLLHRPSLTILFPRPLHQIPTLLSQTQRILRTRPSPTVRFPSPIMLQTNPTSLLRQHNQRPSFLHLLLRAIRLPLPVIRLPRFRPVLTISVAAGHGTDVQAAVSLRIAASYRVRRRCGPSNGESVLPTKAPPPAMTNIF